MKWTRVPWSASLVEKLRDTFYSEEGFDAVAHVREGIETGRMEAWEINDGTAYAVTQTWNDSLFLWCFQGVGLREWANCMYAVAQKNDLKRLKFGTHHRGIPRMLKYLNPVQVAEDIYEIGVTL